MEPLRNGKPGPNECWDELADHSITHDDLGSPVAERAAVPVPAPMSPLMESLYAAADLMDAAGKDNR